MAQLMKMLQPLQSEYVDRRFDGTKEEYFQQLELSSTLYIGNLSFYTTEDQVYELFGKVGVVRRVIMGLDRNTKTPCGFCFVVYHTRADALAAVRYLNGTKLDNRQLRVDVDYGFEEGRQFGRGRSGGQVRDEFRTDYDADRGGYGRVVAQQLASQQLAIWQEVQAGAMLGAGVLPMAAGGAVFFGKDQRETLGQHTAGAGGNDGAEDGVDAGKGSSAVVNPRMAGRDRNLEEDDLEGEGEEQHRAKRRRVDVQNAATAGAEDAAAEMQEGDAEAHLSGDVESCSDGEGDEQGGDDESQQQQAGWEEEEVPLNPSSSDDEGGGREPC